MPTIEENIEQWGARNDWSESGDDWSAAWGGTDYLWWETLHPRIMAFLPAARILEIAPGYGRITRFLHPFCDRLTIVDLNETCILRLPEAVRRRRSHRLPRERRKVPRGSRR